MEVLTKTAKPVVSSGSQPHAAISGSGMDKQRVVNKNIWKKASLLVLVVAVVGYFIFNAVTQFNGKSLQVLEQSITISTVTEGFFEDFIPIRARVTPAKTVYLDAIEGGRVERVLVEDGAIVKAGDLLVELSNTSLQLEVTRNEAVVAEQLNNMSSIELSLEQNRLMHKRNLVEINYQITKLTRQVEREKKLVSQGHLAESAHQETLDELAYFKARKDVTIESQATDALMQEKQFAFLKVTTAQLNKNLGISRKNLDDMNVKAPFDGKLSGFDIEIGQSISRGGRLGQIDSPNDFKLTAFIDEFYVTRIDLGQEASFEKDGTVYRLTVAKIYPNVKNGQFEIDLAFVGDAPKARRGQSIQAKLTLGDTSKALLIPNGSFFQDTGGNWIFVVTNNGNEATKRSVRLGRRNSQFIEVIEGLEKGERVVTSSYANYQSLDRLKLSADK